MNSLNVITAFIAGLVSFLSPCVLPLIPGFLAYLAGASLKDSAQKRRVIFLNSLFFVLGFSVVFALLGVVLNTILERIAYDAQIAAARVGGLIIIFFGLYLTGLIRIPFFEKEHKFRITSPTRSRYITSFLFGLAFAAGWTPCVGVVLGSILGLAATHPASAFTLLLVYALGLGLPFLLVGIFASGSARYIEKYQWALKYINVAFGILLIILGILAFTRNLSAVANIEIINSLLLY